MNHTILIAYASYGDTTPKVAEALGKTLREGGTAVDVQPIENVTDLTPYRAVIIGAPVYNDAWLADGEAFIRAHRDTLSQIPVAYFVVSITMLDDTPKNRERVAAVTEPIREAVPEVQPFELGLFAGILDYADLSLFRRVTARLGLTEPFNFRDRAAIRYWAVDLRRRLTTIAA